MPIGVHVILGEVHRRLCETMLEHARAVASSLDAEIQATTWVPGSLEYPLATKQILETCPPDAIVIFGVIRKGRTKHGEVMAHQVTNLLLQLQLQYGVPMAIAIIGPCSSMEHARKKAKQSAQKAMRSVVQMVKLKSRLSEHRKRD